jgi:hypothetical protein
MASTRQREAAKKNVTKARELGIEGRSKMGEDELKHAVAGAQGGS